MPELPGLTYTNNNRKAHIKNFGGIKADASEGGIYAALNMSNIDYPALSTRLGFADFEALLDEEGRPVTLPKIGAAATDPSGETLVLLGEGELWVCFLSEGFWRKYELPESVDAEGQTIMSFKREHKVTAKGNTTYEYTFYVMLILPARVAFIRSERETKDRTGAVTDETTRYYSGVLPSAKEPISWTVKFAAPMDPATFFGYGRGSTSPAPVDIPDGPVKLAEGESVVSVQESAILPPPGLNVTMHKKPAVGEEVTKTDFVRESFSRDEALVRLELYNAGGGSYDWYDFGSVVFSGDAGFEPNSRTYYDREPDYFYYSPVEGTYEMYIDIPDGLRGAFVLDNRLWAWDEKTIYASQLGAYESFSVDGTDAGGWSSPIVLGEELTAGCIYGGHPVFFTENHIITVYGSYPSTYSLRIDDAPGVAADSAASLKRCGGYLYYLSKAGVMRYGGNFPVCISHDLTKVQLMRGRAGADERYYILWAQYGALEYTPVGSTHRLWQYDTLYGTWQQMEYKGSSGQSEEGGATIEEPVFVNTTRAGMSALAVIVNGEQVVPLYVPTFERQAFSPNAVTREAYAGYNDSYFWAVRFGRFFCSSSNVKGLKQIQLRARLISQPRENGARLCVKICYDDADASLDERAVTDDMGFETIYELELFAAEDEVEGALYKTRNIDIPIIPRRFDNFKLEISGTERWTVESLSFEYDISSEKI